jgi:hypothetical protein
MASLPLRVRAMVCVYLDKGVRILALWQSDQLAKRLVYR